MKRILFFLGALLLLSACKEKRIIVMSKGVADINTDNKTIKAKDGAGHEEKAFVVSGNGDFRLSTPAGEATVSFPDAGLYILNVKNDTIIGGYQHYGEQTQVQKVITQDELKHRIDSIILLSEGKNASAANRTFYILPNHAVKISENTAADVVGPYHRMRSAEKIDGKDPEIYHFYSIKEIREKIAEMQALTVGEKK
ncbi:MAG: lipoprotein [Sediminibacterium sp.]